MSTECLFCKIAAGEIASDLLYEDEKCVAFNDIAPQAPVHLLIIPKRHIESLDKTESGDEPLIGHLLAIGAKLARDHNVAESGYRTVINTNHEGGQTVYHLHVHLLGGRQFVFPPG